MAPKSKAEQDSGRRPTSEKEGDDYRLRRERNNIAVKKSREKSRSKAVETTVRVETLKRENEELEGKVSHLTKELSLLKELLLSSAGKKRKTEGAGSRVPPVQVPTNQVPNKHVPVKLVPYNQVATGVADRQFVSGSVLWVDGQMMQCSDTIVCDDHEYFPNAADTM